ncbi:hypothetical protein QJS04_geneDACA020953 [Acorus gramineus]|uniref:Reverse transcriptase domain-containing protein n=1 Tax=Acorus gramineus TaxID=55184 RepID=A0AAV9B229_ACOGR|nr:hypothetical protein QJS04_geneDACA020953 [Acorus gramineus]
MWLQLGDRNSKFFYASFTGRKATNTLRKVILPDGSSLFELEDVEAETIRFYSNLLNRENGELVPKLSFPRSLTQEDINSLNREITEKEVTDTLFSMRKGGSPGPDEFTVEFFRVCWDVVKQDTVAAVQAFYSSRYMLRQINHSFIALIPKSKAANTLDEFRPISLCNTVYKLITKTMASRIQYFLPHLISSHQSAFIKGRNIAHSTLLAHELVHYLNTTPGIERTCIKILDFTQTKK